MGGDATFSGTNYQAGVIAYVFVHVLTESKLRWLSIADDTPVAVSGEVRGPGDDARIEFRPGVSSLEVQAKHGLKPQKCVEAFRAIGDASAADDTTSVVLVVDSSSSASIRYDLKRDLDRLRSGRSDELKDVAEAARKELDHQALAVMGRVHVRTLDVDQQADAGATRALELLSENLDDASHAMAAWAVLENEAAAICAGRSRRDRKALIELLNVAGFSLRPPKQTRKWHDDLRHSRKLLGDDEPELVLAFVKEVEADFRRSGAKDPEVLYRLNQHRASALLQLSQYREAIDSANRALDHKPDGLHALVTLANAQALNGDISPALETSTKTTSLHPEAPTAWLMRFQLALQPGQDAVDVPANVAATPEFRLGLIQISLFQGDFARARELTASLMQEGDRSARVLLFRVESLLADIELAHQERTARTQEIDRLCTEVLEEGVDLSDRAIQRALVRRSTARRILGRIEEAEQDSNRAISLRRDDASALAEAAQVKLEAGDEQGALDLLVGPFVDENPMLVAMRAGLLATHNESQKARKDLDTVLQAIPTFHEPDKLRSAAAEVAIFLKDVALARKLIEEMARPEGQATVHETITLARIAVLEQDFERAEYLYRDAADVEASHRTDLLSELGSQYLLANRPKDAVRVFREARPLPVGAERPFVRALVSAGELVEAHGELERLAAAGPMPDWAVAFAAQIALRRNNPKEGAEYLEDLIARGAATPNGRLTLTKTLVDLEQPARALFHARELLSEAGLTPRERMFLAQLLLNLGKARQAIEVGLKAYRAEPSDPDLSRAFSSIVFLSKLKPAKVEQVASETYVRLKSADGGKLEYVIFENSIQAKVPHELSRQEAESVGLIGMRVGDTFVENSGAWFSKDWTVEAILPVDQYLANDIISSYSTRFPGADFFAVGFHFNAEAPGLADFQPMIASTHEHKRQQQQILDVYQEQCLPLAFVAKLSGASLPSLMAELSKSDGGRPVYVEWGDAAGRLGSRETVRQRGTAVLTRSALVTLQERALLARSWNDRQLIAPRSLRDELRAELTEAKEHVREGWRILAPSDRGISFNELEAGHPVLVEQEKLAQAILDWADAHVTFLPRPLEAFEDGRLRGEDLRERLGESSNDALELAMFTPAALYADDLGLRRFSQAFGAKSFSTVTLVQVWAEEGSISTEQRDRLLVDLLSKHYYAIEPSANILLEALAPGRSSQTRRDVYSLLGAYYVEAPTAARTIVAAVKTNALRSVQMTPAEQIVTSGLEGMTLRLTREAAARLVFRFAEIDLALLPNEQRFVKQSCVRFAKPPR